MARKKNDITKKFQDELEEYRRKCEMGNEMSEYANEPVSIDDQTYDGID